MSIISLAERLDRSAIETGENLALKLDSDGLIPVVTTCVETGTVLMQAWMNLDAIARTIETGEAHYFSRSRQELWHKGATSGQVQTVVEFRVDCDQDSLWLIVRQAGEGCCHVGYSRCFYRTLPLGTSVDPDTPIRLTTTDTLPKTS